MATQSFRNVNLPTPSFGQGAYADIQQFLDIPGAIDVGNELYRGALRQAPETADTLAGLFARTLGAKDITGAYEKAAASPQYQGFLDTLQKSAGTFVDPVTGRPYGITPEESAYYGRMLQEPFARAGLAGMGSLSPAALKDIAPQLIGMDWERQTKNYYNYLSAMNPFAAMQQQRFNALMGKAGDIFGMAAQPYMTTSQMFDAANWTSGLASYEANALNSLYSNQQPSGPMHFGHGGISPSDMPSSLSELGGSPFDWAANWNIPKEASYPSSLGGGAMGAGSKMPLPQFRGLRGGIQGQPTGNAPTGNAPYGGPLGLNDIGLAFGGAGVDPGFSTYGGVNFAVGPDAAAAAMSGLSAGEDPWSGDFFYDQYGPY